MAIFLTFLRASSPTQKVKKMRIWEYVRMVQSNQANHVVCRSNQAVMEFFPIYPFLGTRVVSPPTPRSLPEHHQRVNIESS